MKIEKTCLHCHKRIFIYPSQERKGEGKYCSVNCFNKRGAPLFERICKACNKTFFVTKKMESKQRRIYCSVKCMAKGYSMGLHPYIIKKLRIEKSCNNCQKKIDLLLSAIKRGQGKFCSRKCRNTFYCKGKLFSKDRKKKLREIASKRVLTDELRKIYSTAKKGYKTPEEVKEKIRQKSLKMWQSGKYRKLIKKKFKESAQKRWANKEYKEKMIEVMLAGLIKRPTSLEKQMINIITKYNLPYKYVGNGSFLIGYKNPDFININGEKKLIEVGNIFHHQGNYVQKREKHFTNYGWKSYIFIGDTLNEQVIVNTLKE